MSGAKLKKELSLFDVFSISTGAMFSSGFFLLPGLAAMSTGPSVFLAYSVAAFFILPAMFSKSELSTAMPRAGGTYYFLDRSLGPLFGTVGGLGIYLALVLKTAFALVGIGAYLSLIVHVPIKPVAIVLTFLITALNVFGAKQTVGLQKGLVTVLLAIMTLFIVVGVRTIFGDGLDVLIQTRLTPFFSEGFLGFFSTVAFVFVSYSGLTNVASVAEEVENPDRNLPLGMMLSLFFITVVYALGVLVMTSVLDYASFTQDITPVYSAGLVIFDGLFSKGLTTALIVVAAVAAFATTGNAGMLSASRYPMGMARDRLLPSFISKLGRFRTPTVSIWMTSGLVIAIILFLNETGIAKLAGSFKLFIFILIHIAVIVMRESRIPPYDPGFKSPFYPWMQIFGILSSGALIVYMGPLSIGVTLAITLGCVVWYRLYARPRVIRHGAIYHWFARLGRLQYHALDKELWGIMREKGLKEEDPFDRLVAQAMVMDLPPDQYMTFEELVKKISMALSKGLSATSDELAQGFLKKAQLGSTPMFKGVCLPGLRLFDVKVPQLVMVRSQMGIKVDVVDVHGEHSPDECIYAFFFLVSPEGESKQHLRVLAQIADVADGEGFMDAWLTAKEAVGLKEVLLRDDRFVTLNIVKGTPTESWIGQRIRDIALPEGALIALIRRGNVSRVPSGSTVLEEYDTVIVIGDESVMMVFRDQFGG